MDSKPDAGAEVDDTKALGSDQGRAESVVSAGGARVAHRGSAGGPQARAPDFDLVLSAVELGLLGQRRGQRSTLFYLRLP
jgi:hypothetical protein